MKECIIGMFLLPAALFAQITLSGVSDTLASFAVTGSNGELSESIGIEEYANLRLQAKTKGNAVFYAAFNVRAMSGTNSLLTISKDATKTEENYSASMELERLYLRINGELADLDMGLMRLAFGYDTIFGPSDYFNPKNPLQPYARTRGILGADLSIYPADELKLQAFAVAPRDPFKMDGSAWQFGTALDKHWSRASLQALYAFENTGKYGVHRAGLSIKADVEVGLVGDCLYTADPQNLHGLDGLAASAGVDYSVLDGALYMVASYLFNGKYGLTAYSVQNPAGYVAQHNVYALLQYNFSDFTNLGGGCFAMLDVESTFVPLLSFTHEAFQGFTINLQAQASITKWELQTVSLTALGRLKF